MFLFKSYVQAGYEVVSCAVFTCHAVSYLQAGYQVFSWAESQTESRKVHRRRYAPGDDSLDQEPMFCFELALKLLYFSALVYDLEEVCFRCPCSLL